MITLCFTVTRTVQAIQKAPGVNGLLLFFILNCITHDKKKIEKRKMKSINLLSCLWR